MFLVQLADECHLLSSTGLQSEPPADSKNMWRTKAIKGGFGQ